MLNSLTSKIDRDGALPLRAWKIDILNRVLDGTIYDVLKYEFHEEKNGSDEYIKQRDRKPSVRTGLIRTVVDDSVSLLFSEGHFPSIQCDDDKLKAALAAITKNASLNDVMIHAATRGSVGSVAILLRFLSKRVFFSVMETTFLTPMWKADEPDTLEKVTELRKVTGKQLVDAGYIVEADSDSVIFWFKREWDSTAETWFQPWKVSEDTPTKVIDTARTTNHSLGFVPIRWIKNLPGGDEVDGCPTFGIEAIETVIEADYQMSQAGRGLTYSSDPTLLIKEPASTDDGKPMVRSASNAIVVDKEGDAKLLEIDGSASEAVVRYVEKLREFALERMHGNRSNADKLSAAQSGRALELMHQALIWLADRLRSSYGEGALLDLYQMIIVGSQKYPITIKGVNYGSLSQKSEISLNWPAWFPATAQDRSNNAQAISSHIDSGTMSAETGVTTIAADYDIPDVQAELAKIDAERKAKIAEIPPAEGKVTDSL